MENTCAKIPFFKNIHLLTAIGVAAYAVVSAFNWMIGSISTVVRLFDYGHYMGVWSILASLFGIMIDGLSVLCYVAILFVVVAAAPERRILNLNFSKMSGIAKKLWFVPVAAAALLSGAGIITDAITNLNLSYLIQLVTFLMPFIPWFFLCMWVVNYKEPQSAESETPAN